eukprot:TRINITY_DN18682_c0_g1_i1.p1 TRINITY_DN18682_c0_g1~~TRINITY_DN18682_c0_g1_i1.p1  ORF type:complete len:3952 (+),score=753.39 TRINITY_DN18682_c0_g1_i1:41-11896(+)
MLERWVASIFSTYLGRYVKNLDQHGLQISMWSGEVVLNDMELSPEALDELDLPIIIDKGIIGKLRIEIPWKNFYSKTCKIEVSDVKLVVLPIKATDWNPEYEEKKAQMRKQAQLRLFESTRATSNEKQQQQQMNSETAPQDEKSDGFGERLTKHILSTLQISINNVLLRYEDSCTDPRRPVGYTLRLDELSAIPCDRDWKVSDVPVDTQMKHHRLCALRGLVVAIDHLPVAPRLTGLSKIANTEKWLSIMNDFAKVTSQLCTPEPLNLELKVTAQASRILDLTLPKTMIDATFKCVNLRLRRWQYDAINRTMRYIKDFSMLEKFRQYRPSAPVKAAPVKWWMFAYKCIQLVRREKRSRTHINWESIVTRSTFKQQYISLFKRTKGVSWHKPIQPNSPDANKLSDLEAKLAAEDIIYFRRLAYFQLKIEQQQHESKGDSDTSEQQSSSKSGWWRWLTWQQQPEQDTDDSDTKEVWKLLNTDNWTPDQKELLYKELGISDESEAIEEQQDVPSTYIQTRIQLTIWKGLIEMCENAAPPTTASGLLRCFDLDISGRVTTDGKSLENLMEDISASELLSYQPDNLPADIAEVIQRHKNTLGLTVLSAVAPSRTFASFQLTELTTRWLDMAKGWKMVTALRDIGLSSDEVADSQFTSLIQKTTDQNNQLLLANISSNPITNAMSVELHLRPVTAIVDVTWLQTVCAFWGVGVYGRCAELEGQETKQPAKKKLLSDLDPEVALKMALENNPTMTISLVVESPCLVVPTDCSDIDSATLVVGAESLKIASKPREDLLQCPASPSSSSATITEVVDSGDYYNRFTICSQYGRIVSTTVREWKAYELKTDEEFGKPVISDCDIDFEIAVSLIPNIQSIPRVLLVGDIPNFVITLTRRNMLTTVLALDNILEFASNLTGRGSDNVNRAEDQDESVDSCSTLANVLGPMPEDKLSMDSVPIKRYCELDCNSGQLILYNPKRTSKIDVVIDLSSGDFEIKEPPNAVCIILGNDQCLWVQLPTGSMHTRWLTGLNRLQGCAGESAKIPSFLLCEDDIQQEEVTNSTQIWMKPNINFGDFKIVVENTSEWVFLGCSLSGEITEVDSKLELASSSLSVATTTSDQPLMFTDSGENSDGNSEEGSNGGSESSSPGFSFWWLSFMRASSYFDPNDPNQPLMQMGIATKGLTFSITPAMAETFELLWDIMNITMLMKAQTLYYKCDLSRDDKNTSHVFPAELPKPFLEKQGMRFVVEVEGELEMNCYRPNGELPVRISGEDFQMFYHDTPYGVSLDGLVKRPVIDDCITTSKWSRFMSSPDEKGRIAFSYSNFQNYGALKSDPPRSRPTHFGGVSFTHQMAMSVSDVEIVYFQTFIWTLLETFKTGTFTRLSFLSWRSVYDGEKVISPWDTYDPEQPPKDPYLDYLKIQMECSNCDIVLPPNRDADSGIFKGHMGSMGISNDFHKIGSSVLLCTKIAMSDITLEVPEEYISETPKGSLFTAPVSMVLDTWGAVIDPKQEHPKSKLCLSIPGEATLMLSDNVYCSLLEWMTQSLMEPYTPHFPVTPQGPPPFVQLVSEWRYNHFSWVLNFADMNIIWLNDNSIPEYTMEVAMAVVLRWYENQDFENDVDITKLKISGGVAKGLPYSDSKVEPNTVMDLLGILKLAIVWRTPPPPSKLRRKQTLFYNISGDGIFLNLDHAVLLNVIDSLLSARAARSGGLKLMGWVEPDGGWPAPGDPWPAPPPQTHIINHVLNASSLKIDIPDVCTFTILGTNLKYCIEPNATVADAPSTRTQIELNVTQITMADITGAKVIETVDGSNAVAISTEQREDGSGWKSVAGRVGEISVAATVTCFSSIHSWLSGVEFKMLSHAWEATPEIRRSKIRLLSSTSQSDQSPDAEQQPAQNTKLDLPEFDLSWTKPKLVILCTTSKTRSRTVSIWEPGDKSSNNKIIDNRERGFVIDFGNMRLVTSKEDDTETVTANLDEASIRSIYRDEFALRPTKIRAIFKRQSVTSETDGLKERRLVTVEGDGIESFFDFSDMRTIAAVVYHYSNTLSTVRGSKAAMTESSDPPTQPQVRLQNITQTMHTNSKNIPPEDDAVNVLSVSLVLPVISISFKSGLKPGELPTPDGLPLPLLEEPVLDSTVSISGISADYNQYSNGAAKLSSSIERLGIDTASHGSILKFENPKVTYHQISSLEETSAGDQLIDVDLGEVTIVVMPRVLFNMTTFVYLPYAAATMPDTFAAPDVMEIDEDWELDSDTVFCRYKQIRVTNNHQNLVVLNGNLHELHLIGDGPLIKLDAGVTLLILGTKLYLYNKQLSDFVDADDGAYVYVPEDRNEIEPGFPAVTNWTQNRKTKTETGLQSSTSVSAKLSLCVILPESQNSEGKGSSSKRQVQLLTTGSGQYSYTVVDDVVTKEDADFSLKGFTVKPASSIDQPPTNNPEDIDTDTDKAHFIVEPISQISATLHDHQYHLIMSGIYVRLSSADVGVALLCVRELQSELNFISQQPRLKINANDDDIIHEAIVVAQNQLSVTGSKQSAKTKKVDITIKTIDVLIVEDSSGFDIPLFFIQLLDTAAVAEDAVEYQILTVDRLMLKVDFYNLEQCEWESVLDKEIIVDLKYYLSGSYKKDLTIGVSKISAFVTPQLMKTIDDAKRFGEAFSTVKVAPTKGAHKSTKFRMYELCNETGYEINVELHGDKLKLANLGTIDFNFGKRYGKKEVTHKLVAAIPDLSTEDIEIDIGRVGTACLLVPVNGSTKKVKLFCTVRLTETGRKKVSIRSSVTVHNLTNVRLQVTASKSEEMVAEPEGSVSIPHQSLLDSYFRITPIGISKDVRYSSAQLGLTYGSFHKLHKALFVVSSSPLVQKLEEGEAPPEEVLHNFTCTIEITTDPVVGNTTITVLPIFTLVNLTGLKMSYTLFTWDGLKIREEKSRFKLFSKSKRCEYETVAKGALEADEEARFTSAVAFHSMYLDVEIVQPTGEVLKRNVSKYPNPFLVRNPGKGHQGRVTSIALSDKEGRACHLSLEYTTRSVAVYCPLWIINQTSMNIELAVHNPMKLSEASSSGALTAGQVWGEGISPGRKPFLMGPPDLPEKEQIGHLYCKILSSPGKNGNAQWSSKIDTSKVGTTGTFECHERIGVLPKTAAFSIEFPWGKVSTRTKVIRFTPRWIVFNRTPKTVFVRHRLGRDVPPGQPIPKSEFLVAPNDMYGEYEGGSTKNRMGVKIDGEEQAQFSKPFLIDQMGDTDINLKYKVSKNKASQLLQQRRDRKVSVAPSLTKAVDIFGDESVTDMETSMEATDEFDVVRVAIFKRGSITYVTLDSLTRPPFVIENRTPIPITVKQQLAEKKITVLTFPAKRTKAFTWESQVGPRVAYIFVGSDSEAMVVNVDPRNKKSREETMQESKTPMGTVYLRVRHRAGTTKISLTMDRQIDNWFNDPPFSITSTLSVQGIGVILQNDGIELAHLSLSTIYLQRKREQRKVTYIAKIGTIQLDDQREKADFPVVLCNRVPRDRAPVLHLRVERTVERSSAAVHIENGFVKFQPLDVKLHDRFLFELLLFSRTTQQKVSSTTRTRGSTYYAFAIDTSLQSATADQDGIGIRPLYLENFKIETLNVTATLLRAAQHYSEDFFKQVLGYLAVFVGSFKDMALEWPSVSILGHCDKTWLVASMLKDKYFSETTRQLLRVAPGVASVTTFVTDLLSTLPIRTVSENAIQYSTPRNRVRPIQVAAATSDTVSPMTSPIISSPVLTGLTPSNIFSNSGSSIVDDPSVRVLPSSSASLQVSCIKFNESANHFATPATEDDGIVFHEVPQAPAMTKRRAQHVEALKKKNWDKFHPCRGFTTWEEYAQACTWEEFRKHTTHQEFKQYVHLAFDEYIRAFLADENATGRNAELCRCEVMEELKASTPGGLPTPSSEQGTKVNMTWYEFAHHTTWDEFRTKSSSKEFKDYVNFARDCHLGVTQGFQKLDKKQIETIFNS